MTAALITAIASFLTAAGGFLTWYVHTHGSSHNGGQ